MNRTQYVNLYNRLKRTRTRYAECIKITRTDGTVYRFTAHDRELFIWESDGGRYAYTPANSFEITALENTIGLVVSNMEVNALIDDVTITEADLRAGLFEHANVEMLLAYWSNSNVGTLPLRTSWIGELSMAGTSFKADLRGIAQLLAQVFVELTSLECRATFCDTRCGLDIVNFTFPVTVTAVNTQGVFTCDIASAQENSFDFGLATFTSGNNDGLSMEIMHNWDDKLELFLPMPYVVDIGDTLNIVQGCDKRFPTCVGFSNNRRFIGEPFLAGNDMLIRYAQSLGQDPEEEQGVPSIFEDLLGI